MLRDAEYFKSKVGGLDGAEDAGDYIVNLVKDKPVPKAVMPDPPTPAINDKTSSENSSEKEKVDEKNNAKEENVAPQ